MSATKTWYAFDIKLCNLPRLLKKLGHDEMGGYHIESVQISAERAMVVTTRRYSYPLIERETEDLARELK